MSDLLEGVDRDIASFIAPDVLKSFLLFAGAGSGKTRTLVNVLEDFRKKHLHKLIVHGRKVAVITYTNAACNEIKERLRFDESFSVSTIHSFAWEIIKPYTEDIREVLKHQLSKEYEDTLEAQKKGRAGTKAEAERVSKLATIEQRIRNLGNILAFTYNPTGTNLEKDSLNHAEVIGLAAILLVSKPLLQSIVIGKYPVLLIDESQDTQKSLINAFITLQREHPRSFCIGLLGDQMQRIYLDGQEDLQALISDEWGVPSKFVNYRCPRRITHLINTIRSVSDGHKQSPDKADEGVTRLFIIDTNTERDRVALEESVAHEMGKVTGDLKWLDYRREVKVLTIEHHMAATRGGFVDFFQPLYELNSTSALDGTMNGISFLIKAFLPLVEAVEKGDDFALAQVVKTHSHILSSFTLKSHPNPLELFESISEKIVVLSEVLNGDDKCSVLDVLTLIFESELLQLPDIFLPVVSARDVKFDPLDDKREGLYTSWEKALNSPLSSLKGYASYIGNKSTYGTHQGVKGLQFPRVLAILDDDDTRGFLFSYEKLFGAVPPTANDVNNIKQGKETGADRTRRLFYVICSRAEESLAVVMYTKKTREVSSFALSSGWFNSDEIIML
jgi:DNA helicase-2/ATP-dependent DNA helicase PcrA